jgi:hypothetical protein
MPTLYWVTRDDPSSLGDFMEQDIEDQIKDLTVELSDFYQFIRITYSQVNIKHIVEATMVSRGRWRMNSAKLRRNQIEKKKLTTEISHASEHWIALNRQLKTLQKHALDAKSEGEKYSAYTISFEASF